MIFEEASIFDLLSFTLVQFLLPPLAVTSFLPKGRSSKMEPLEFFF